MLRIKLVHGIHEALRVLVIGCVLYIDGAISF
jgi:hypothetical protein